MSEVTRDFVAALIVLGLAVAFVAGKRLVHVLSPSPSQEQCAALLDRYVEQASRQKHPEIEDDDIERAQEASIGKPERLADLRSCRDELTRAQVECGLSSPNVDELERCVQ